jgi:Fic family protein
MIYATPPLTDAMQRRLDELDQLREELGHQVGQPSLWLGTLRRVVKAAAAESSVSIEGFSVSGAEAVAIVAGERPAAVDDENQRAVASYARAMDHVGVMASDPVFEWRDRVLLDLHFDACYFQRDQRPGLWRNGPILVTGSDGRPVYEGPAADEVVPLMGEVVEWLRTGDLDAHVVVRAAMAHLHTVSVHPFSDGNGRISRIVQSLVLALEGLLSAEFASIEEYLAGRTPEYYAVLQQVQGGRYQPDRDASAWVLFCIEAHIAQAQQRLEQIAAAARRWRALEDLVFARSWPDRLVVALEQSLIGGTDRARYERETGISPATASTDFRRLLDAGLITQVGRGRNTRYLASDGLRARLDEAG